VSGGLCAQYLRQLLFCACPHIITVFAPHFCVLLRVSSGRLIFVFCPVETVGFFLAVSADIFDCKYKVFPTVSTFIIISSIRFIAIIWVVHCFATIRACAFVHSSHPAPSALEATPVSVAVSFSAIGGALQLFVITYQSQHQSVILLAVCRHATRLRLSSVSSKVGLALTDALRCCELPSFCKSCSRLPPVLPAPSVAGSILELTTVIKNFFNCRQRYQRGTDYKRFHSYGLFSQNNSRDRNSHEKSE